MISFLCRETNKTPGSRCVATKKSTTSTGGNIRVVVVRSYLYEIELLVKVFDKGGFVLDGVHGVPAVDEQLRELGCPVVGELVRDLAVEGLGLLGKLVVVVLLIPQRSEQVADRL